MGCFYHRAIKSYGEWLRFKVQPFVMCFVVQWLIIGNYERETKLVILFHFEKRVDPLFLIKYHAAFLSALKLHLLLESKYLERNNVYNYRYIKRLQKCILFSNTDKQLHKIGNNVLCDWLYATYNSISKFTIKVYLIAIMQI